MALQGSLRDFSITEILQLVGTQRKTGCLIADSGSRRVTVYVNEGRIVSTRTPGMDPDDPLLAFLRKIHRLSDEQYRGILTIHRESGRDLEDLLLNGRYLSAEELGGYVERQILDHLQGVVGWSEGMYRFDPHTRWAQSPIARLSIEGMLMEMARRADEEKRSQSAFGDSSALLSVVDLPDPTEPLTDEERELFGIVDGRRTLGEVIAAAPLTAYEAQEALLRMLEAGWIEISGRRAADAPAAAPPERSAPAVPRRSLVRDAMIAAAVIATVVVLRLASHLFTPGAAQSSEDDVYAAAQIRDLRFALDLYRREKGRYPDRLDQLVEDRWITSRQAHVPGFDLSYRRMKAGQDYALEVHPEH